MVLQRLISFSTSCIYPENEFVSGEPWQRRVNRQSDNELFGQDDFFGDDFDEMDKTQKAHEQFEEGMEIWEQKCLKVGGQKALDDWLEAQENLIFCVMENFEVATIQSEIEAKRRHGDLDEVFKKYCG